MIPLIPELVEFGMGFIASGTLVGASHNWWSRRNPFKIEVAQREGEVWIRVKKRIKTWPEEIWQEYPQNYMFNRTGTKTITMAKINPTAETVDDDLVKEIVRIKNLVKSCENGTAAAQLEKRAKKLLKS